jgi:peptidoglycan/LPS O-acetylase OafA/YrhL
MKHLPAIDGLRAIAVLAVVAYHAGLPIPAGFVGVDVFFVISGYVITRMLAAEHAETGRIDFAAFYARRVRRILPALIVLVITTLAASSFLLGPVERAALMRSAIASMGVAANFHFQAVTGGYFDASADLMPLLHLWSLAVEEQFYFVWPLLLAVLLRFRRAPVLLGVLALGSFALAQAWPQQVAFYQMPARFWELAVGGLIALAPATSRPVYAYVGLAVLAAAVAVPLDHFPGDGALPAVLGAALVLHAVHGGLRVPALELRPVRWVGLISYGLYLWHWPLLALNRAYSLDAPTLGQNLALCGLAVVLATLSHRYVETPFRKRHATKGRTIGAGIAACLVLAGCAGGVGATIHGDDFGARTAKDFPAITAQCHAEISAPAQLPPASCGTGDVVLWGDSHAYAWRPYAERFGAVRQLTRGNCPPSAGDAHGSRCAQFDALAVEEAQHAKVVVLAEYWERYLHGAREREAREGIESALAAVAPHAQRVVVMGPTPTMPYNPQKCIAKDRIAACTVSRAAFDREATPIRAYLRGLVARYPNAEYVEPVDHFCTATTCPMMKDGRSLYWDDDHISATAARNFR